MADQEDAAVPKTAADPPSAILTEPDIAESVTTHSDTRESGDVLSPSTDAVDLVAVTPAPDDVVEHTIATIQAVEPTQLSSPPPTSEPLAITIEAAALPQPSPPVMKTSTSPIPPDGAPPTNQLPNSQPMSVSSSKSSHDAEPAAAPAPDTNGASPYGTRSRNRTGTSRINYAEDADMDFEYAIAPTSKRNSTAAAVHTPQLNDGDVASSGLNTRRSSQASLTTLVQPNKTAAATASRDHLPGMSSFSINPDSSPAPTAPAPSRKRKAPGAAPASHTNGVTAQTTSQGSAKRAAAHSMASATAASTRTTSIMTFEGCKGYLKNGKLRADDGTTLSVDDQIYLICEPPGEPYYLARIMEFLHVDNDRSLPVDSLRINWFFRPRDIQRKVNDTRVVFASMQSDTSPITSLRGKCRVQHRSEIEDLEEYRKTKDSFWYEKMFDRYIHRYYEVIPTSQVINVPNKVKKVLDDRWKYVIVEIGRGKELTSAIKSCKRCVGYCASNDSVDCAVCKNTYHMNCVRPPLLKKPARGFGWSCGPCSRRQERRLEARNTAAAQGQVPPDGEEEEVIDEEEEEHNDPSDSLNGDDTDTLQTAGPRPPTTEQLAQSRVWPYRYLGIHCRVEDALDYDDRIYPRASSRLGPKHQANVAYWYGHPVEYVKNVDAKRKYNKGGAHKASGRFGSHAAVVTEAERIKNGDRPQWIMDEPQGFIHRGEDHPNKDSKSTTHTIFRMPEVGEMSSRGEDDQTAPSSLEEREKLIQEYMDQAQGMAQPLFNLRPFSTNFIDKSLELLIQNNYNVGAALTGLKNLKRRQHLKEPELTEDEIRKFEDGVAKYGSELRNVSRHVGKSQKHGEIVRFYYMWKKTERGRRIWDNYEGRKGKKQVKQTDSRLVDDVADDVDDSAFDVDKAVQRKRGFECKFCASRRSPQWRRAPGTAPGTTVLADPNQKGSKDKKEYLMLALCQRCAGLWRKYGIQWENIDEVARKVAQGGGRALKRRVDEELLIELVIANQANSISLSTAAVAAANAVGLEINNIQPAAPETSKKKLKMAAEQGPSLDVVEEPVKKKPVEKRPESPLIPEQPQFRRLPCDICRGSTKTLGALMSCRHCRMTVHLDCYGITPDRVSEKWLCDTCTNDVSPVNNVIYECLMCPQFAQDNKSVMETPKAPTKKRSEREKEKERLEKEMVNEATALYLRQQAEKGWPLEPRQSLKVTSQRYWCHVICSIMHQHIRYANPGTLKEAEGFAMIAQNNPKSKASRCKLCKDSRGYVLFCDQCEAPMHASCAQRAGYTLGLQLGPQSKNSTSRKITIAGETGIPEPKVYCKDHGEKKHLHSFAGLTKLDDVDMHIVKAYAIAAKSALNNDLTGSARRADLVQAATKQVNGHVNGSGHGRRGPKTGDHRIQQLDGTDNGDQAAHESKVASTAKHCVKCKIDVSPVWHKTMDVPAYMNGTAADGQAGLVNGYGIHDVIMGNTDGSEKRSNGYGKRRGRGAAEAAADKHYLCHKCYIRRKRSPTPPRQLSPKRESPLLEDESRRTLPTPSMAWPASVPPGPPSGLERYVSYPAHGPEHVQGSMQTPPPPPQQQQQQKQQPQQQQQQQQQQQHYHHPTPHQRQQSVHQSSLPPTTLPLPPSVSPYRAHERLPSAMVHPPPGAPVPPPGHYVVASPAVPLPPKRYLLPEYPAFLDDRGAYRQRPPAHYGPAPQPNGYHSGPPSGSPMPGQELPSFQFRRDANNNLVQVPYIPPQARHATPTVTATAAAAVAMAASAYQSPPAASQPAHQLGPQSPNDQGPHGPPEADSNPFAVPHVPSSGTATAQPVQHGYDHAQAQAQGQIHPQPQPLPPYGHAHGFGPQLRSPHAASPSPLPQQQYPGNATVRPTASVYESPRARPVEIYDRRERESLPPGPGPGRDRRWSVGTNASGNGNGSGSGSGQPQVVNGASNSPSVRNLLH